MAVAALEPPVPVGVLAEAVQLLRALVGRSWEGTDDEHLVEAVAEVQTVRSVLRAVEAGLLAEVDARDVARQRLGWGSTADWYTHLAGVRRGQGRRTVEHARRLLGEQTTTYAALSAGAVSPEQAEIIVDAVDRLPTPEEVRRHGEQVMIDQAGHLTATDLARTVVRVLDTIDPHRVERERERSLDRLDRGAHLRRFLTITDDGCGGVRVQGRGSAEDGALLRSALLPLSAPVPGTDPETGEALSDPRDFGVRLWDALVTMAGAALATDLPSASHGSTPRVSVTVDLATLQELADRSGLTDDGTELAPGVVRRLACDAELVPVVLGSRSEVLDVGRRQRLVTPGLWRALVARDGCCTFPGCSRPPVMCHAHHVVPWALGGPTSLDNLAMLCGFHHRLVHDSPWKVRITGADPRPEFLPPPAPGRAPTWIRHRPRRE